MTSIRVDKFLSHVGIGTRTEVKKLIKQKKIKVNGRIVIDPGLKVDDDKDQVSVNGDIIRYQEYIYIMLHKPKGVISATEDKKERTVIDLINHPMKSKLFPVGRLDKDTTGLLLLTNDGHLSHQLLSPKKHVAKTYYALIDGHITEEILNKFRSGIVLDDGYACMPAVLKLCSEGRKELKIFKEWDKHLEIVSITIREGKFHQIKRMFEAVDMKVMELYRHQMGSLILDQSLVQGQSRELSQIELEELKTGDMENV